MNSQQQFLNPLLKLEKERLLLLDLNRINLKSYKEMAQNNMFSFWNPTPAPPSDPKFFNTESGELTIPISGVLLSDTAPLFMDGWFCSYGYVRQMVSFALKNEDVKNIKFIVNSPGGMAYGMLQAAEEIRILSEAKPTESVVQLLCCSAAYMLAANTRQIRSENSAVIGSIGVYSVLMDDSKMMEDWGLSFIRVAWPNGKGLGAEGFSSEYVERARKDIRRLSKDVEKSVASRVDKDKIEELDGNHFSPEEALKLGLIDGIVSPEESLEYKPNKEKGMSDNPETKNTPQGQQTNPATPRAEDNPPPEPATQPNEEDEKLLAEIRDLMREQRDILIEIRDRMPAKAADDGQGGSGGEETPPSGKHPAKGLAGIQSIGSGASAYFNPDGRQDNPPKNEQNEQELAKAMFALGGMDRKPIPKKGA